MADRYSIAFTAAGLAYVRLALGKCPHDEVDPLIQNLEQQRAEQDAPPVPSGPSPGAELPEAAAAEPRPLKVVGET